VNIVRWTSDAALGWQGSPQVPKRVDQVDVLVGKRIRAYRLGIGMSQSALAEKVGVTFQQIQKYEKGTNRVGSGRLKKVATALGVKIASFFPEERSGGDKSVSDDLIEMLGEPHATRLLTAFHSIDGAKRRLALVKLAEGMAKPVRRAER
jgi:transcriptional regulator with XRE-family HTH domain